MVPVGGVHSFQVEWAHPIERAGTEKKGLEDSQTKKAFPGHVLSHQHELIEADPHISISEVGIKM